ncbi:MAG: acetate--CoA ligase family protein, partial [Thermoanaerobaculia bacterium]|nr:acetate--CoA ligase family protein [Thermoanaerobaculia bacterium]
MQGSLTRESPSDTRLERALGSAVVEKRTQLLEHEANEVLRSIGIEVPDHVFIRSDENLIAGAERAWESLWSSRVVVKVVSPEIAHKTEVGGVNVVPKRPADISNAMEKMLAKLTGFDIRGFLISEFVEYDDSPGGELLVNLRWNSEFGPVVSIGLGGLSAEALGRNLQPGVGMAILSPESTHPRSIAPILHEKAFAPLISEGLRDGISRIPLDTLGALTSKLLAFASRDIPAPFEEIEINPLVSRPHGPLALDAFVRLGYERSEPPARPLDKIHRLLRPKSIAVVGVSRSMNPGRTIVANLVHDGFDRERIWIVKEGCEEIEGCRCVDSIGNLPEPVDLIVLSIGADAVIDAIDEIVAHRKAESVIVIPGGLGEREGSGRLEEAIRSRIESSRPTEWRGPVVNGGNSLGIRSIRGNYDTTFLPRYKVAPAERPGAPIALISQSGAFAVSIGSRLAPVSPRTVVSIGNQIDLTFGDYMEAMADDPEIDLFAFYVEGFRPGDGRRWRHIRNLRWRWRRAGLHPERVPGEARRSGPDPRTHRA